MVVRMVEMSVLNISSFSALSFSSYPSLFPTFLLCRFMRGPTTNGGFLSLSLSLLGYETWKSLFRLRYPFLITSPSVAQAEQKSDLFLGLDPPIFHLWLLLLLILPDMTFVRGKLGGFATIKKHRFLIIYNQSAIDWCYSITKMFWIWRYICMYCRSTFLKHSKFNLRIQITNILKVR